MDSRRSSWKTLNGKSGERMGFESILQGVPCLILNGMTRTTRIPVKELLSLCQNLENLVHPEHVYIY